VFCKKRNFFVIVLILTFFLFSFIFSFISLQRHNNFSSQGWDLALYDQIIWLYSQNKKPYSTLVNRLDLADRFRPIIFTLVPLYWLQPDVRLLLIAQAVILVSGLFPIFLLARNVLKDGFSALVISISYLLFIGIQSFIIDDFHEICFLPPLLLWFFYFFLPKRNCYIF
jgi:uncharacterized membrane protein